MNKKMVIISIITLIIDQLLKSLCELGHASITVIDNIFNITFVKNYGAAWSILNNHPTLLIALTLFFMVIIYNMMFSYEDTKVNNLAFGMLFGGIIGNLIDRVFMGCVRDFIDIKIFGYNYPIFNIADIAICVGIFLLIISTLKGSEKGGNKSRGKSRKNR